MKTRQTSISSSVAPSKTHKDTVITDIEEANSRTPTANIPIIPIDAAVAVPKATMLGTRLDLVSPQHGEKAWLVASLARVYTSSKLNPPLLEDLNQALICSFQKLLKATMVLVYQRLDTIECPSIDNPYQPPLGATKWLNYEEGEVDS
jgi:hypothetical protein